MRRRNLLLVVAAVLAVGGLLWLRAQRTETSQARLEDTKGPKPRPLPRKRDRQSTTDPGQKPSPPVPLTRAQASIDESAARGAFAGLVVDWGTGKAVAGAELSFEGALGIESTESDANGGFRFVPSDPGRYRLASVTRDGYLPFAPELGASPIEVMPRPGVIVDGLRVYIRPAIDYRGTVVDSQGAPVAGARVRLRGADLGERRMAPIRSDFATDEDGGFVFQAPDGAVLEARDARGRVGVAVVDRAVQVSHEITIELKPPEVAEAGAVQGRVVDGDGAPISGATVTASPPRGDGFDRDDIVGATSTATDSEGRFSLEVPAGETFTVTARARDRLPARAKARSGVADLELTLESGLRVRGRVVDPSGEAVPGFHVAVFRRFGPTQQVLVTTLSVFSGDGRFEARGLEAGDYELVAMAYGLAKSAPVAATASEDPQPVEIRLVAGATLVGTVVDKDTQRGLPRAKVTVESRFGGGAGARPMTATAVTDDDGNFELSGLGPGRASVVVAAFAHHGRIVSGLDAAPGSRIGPMKIELEAVREGEKPSTEFAGIGAAIGGHERGIAIRKVFPGGGAADAELVEGDIITAVDGNGVDQLGFEASLQKIRGPVGTTVALDIERGDDRVKKQVVRKKLRF